jgi:hypothetical protein
VTARPAAGTDGPHSHSADTAPDLEAGCAVCAALMRQSAEARAGGDERCVKECEAELSNHRDDV